VSQLNVDGVIRRFRLAWFEVGGNDEDHVFGGAGPPWRPIHGSGVDGPASFVQLWLSAWLPKRLVSSAGVLLAS